MVGAGAGGDPGVLDPLPGPTRLSGTMRALADDGYLTPSCVNTENPAVRLRAIAVQSLRKPLRLAD